MLLGPRHYTAETAGLKDNSTLRGFEVFLTTVFFFIN